MTVKAFFDTVRPMFHRGLNPVQVQVMEAILDQTKTWPREHTAYVLATAYGEAKFTPQRENMFYTAARIRQIWPTRPEAVAFAGSPKALANSVYGDRMGNRPGTDDGWDYRGGGIDQLTGRENYTKVGLANNPDEILKPEKAVASIVQGMSTGRYRGHKLADFDRPNGFDYKAARAIINNDVRVHGPLYAQHAVKFLTALCLLNPQTPRRTA